MNAVLAEFRAPWSRQLRLVTSISIALLLVVMLIGLLSPHQFWLWRLAMIGMPLAALLGALPFMVRGYVLTPSSIEVKRLGWITSVPLTGLITATGTADALRGSLRLWGNGGLFAITGWFWNRRLGRFRAFATDPQRAVILRYPNRTIVVTPHDPQHFIVRVRTLTAMAPEFRQ